MEKARVLVVEDHEDAGFVVCEMLDVLGYDADHVPDGHAAVEYAVCNRYVAVLMDIEMPVLDGLQATEQIRKIESQAGIGPNHIIGTTGHTSTGVRILCEKAGMNGFLLKPFSFEQLEQALVKRAMPANP